MIQLSGLTPDDFRMMVREEVMQALGLAAPKGKNVVETKAPKLLNESEVRARLGISHSTLWHWQRSGYLPVVKIGSKSRWKEEDIHKLMGA